MHVRLYVIREHRIAQPPCKVRSCEELGGQENRGRNGGRSTGKRTSELQCVVAEACFIPWSFGELGELMHASLIAHSAKAPWLFVHARLILYCHSTWAVLEAVLACRARSELTL